MKYERHPTIDNHLRKVRLHTEPYLASILDREIIIFPEVMSPKYDRSSQIFISIMPSQRGKTFLEIGCGSGIVSVFAALNGASKIVAVDINNVAIQNTQENFKKHQLLNADAFYSDLFENVKGTFDTVFFNAPFHGNRPVDILEYGTSDYNYKTLKRFFSKVSNYLNPDGEIFLGFSDMSDNQLLQRFITLNKLHIKNFQTQENGDWVAYFYTIVRDHKAVFKTTIRKKKK